LIKLKKGVSGVAALLLQYSGSPPLIEKPGSLCEGCILGKQHRESFPSGKSIRAKAPLEIVHSDLCGPMQTPSLAGNHYILTFIDDFTRKT